MSADDSSASDPDDGDAIAGDTAAPVKGDFTAGLGLIWLAALAIPVGLLCGVLALVLLKLIGLFTNIFYFQQFWIPDKLLSPASNALGWLALLVPVLGGLIVGLMARFGSERIRGHGIPEAIEAILIGGSRMQPRVALLKPLSSAIVIGSGGPFGAEGPIIMTGGACGSIIAQVFRMTNAERKTLLVAGAAGGMSATFGTPVAAVLLAVELLLFEWKPRSLVPVALASAAAALLRPFLGMDPSPLIPVQLHLAAPDLAVLLASALVGISAGALSFALTSAVYAAEDAFHRLPIHWMWWPMLGGLAVGIGGMIEPRALGVGYDVIAEVLQSNQVVVRALVAMMLVKGTIWAIALGSGTSGGVLAPLLMMGAMLGAVESPLLPGHDPRLWALVSMGAVMGGTMRAPLTGVIFALEITYDIRALLPLLIATTIAHAFTVLLMKRSILTEKIARRGYHVSHEYSVDPLERLSVAQVMSAEVVTVPAGLPIRELVLQYFLGPRPKRHQGYPVVGEGGRLLGVVTQADLLEEWIPKLLADGDPGPGGSSPIIAFDLVTRAPITICPDETCRTAAERMAQMGVGRLMVVSPESPGRVVGVMTRSDLLKSRAMHRDEEDRREQFLGKRFRQPAKDLTPVAKSG